MKVTFENATFQDSVTKAARVAPTKGEAFDKASGILMSLDPEDNTVTLRATNLDIFYLEVVDAVEVESEVTWRFHASTLAAVAAKLPIGSGKTCTITQEGGNLVLRSGRTKAEFRAMDWTYYPTWDPFDPEKLEVVADLGTRIKQVEWAALSDEGIVFSGIHLDGKNIVATDRIRMAAVPCDAEPIFKPITIPSGVLKPVLTTMRDVAVGIDEGMFLLMPDVSTQIRTRIYDKEFPNVIQLFEKFGEKWTDSVKFRKNTLVECIDRAVIFAQHSRTPQLTFIIGKGEIGVMCSDADMGLLGDAFSLDGQAQHKRLTIKFTPKNLTEALNNAPSEEVEFFYNSTDPTIPIKIDGGSGYRALVMPRREMSDD